ncbi:P-loop NTPase fold protein [Collimonas sp. NPDC087041]|uniref:KAP family P-loop NTPase fold protein n=1 Tax=Collimonas sp. NPDC087041 TaxID=3363960 RepID=UPI0038220E16
MSENETSSGGAPKITTLNVNLSADSPQFDPKLDAFGYAPFAHSIANAIRTTPNPRGLVMGVDGVWGSGKSTLLKFVKYYISYESDPIPSDLTTFEEAKATSLRFLRGIVSHCSKIVSPGRLANLVPVPVAPPIIIEFNPWWFNDRNQLASQFLGQFRSRLPDKNKKFKKIGSKLADYSDGITQLVAMGANSYLPGSGAVVKGASGFVNKKNTKDIPTIKEEISKALEKTNQRFVVLVDDIDRLTPDEIREVFKVIKALADFPNVIYLLAFDRALVAQALQGSMGLQNGEAYLEKIIQVPFNLPSVTSVQLTEKFIDDLNVFFGDVKDPEFDESYWWNVFQDGLKSFIKKPRDLVRIVNALSVTFPAVRGEVNTVDFIALEFLRIFLPYVYNTIRDNPERFTGLISSGSSQHADEKIFHEAWISAIPEFRRASMKQLIKRIFPRLNNIWGNTSYGSSFLREWKAAGRVCDDSMFPTYFQFGISPRVLTRSELQAFTAHRDVEALVAAWQFLLDQKTNGNRKAVEIFQRIRDIDDLDPIFCQACSEALFRIGDRFLERPGERTAGFFSAPASWQMSFCLEHLMAKIPSNTLEAWLIFVIKEASALSTATSYVNFIEEIQKPENVEKAGGRDSILLSLSAETVSQIKALIVRKLRSQMNDGSLLNLPNLPLILTCWLEWDGLDGVQTWMSYVIGDDKLLVRLLEHFLQIGSSQASGDRVSKRTASMDPNYLTRYLDPSLSLGALSDRVNEVSSRQQITPLQQEAILEFQRGMCIINSGGDPGSPFPRLSQG